MHILLGLPLFSVTDAYKLDCYCTELTHTLNGRTHFISHTVCFLLRHRRLLYVLLNYYRTVQRTRPSIRVSITSTLIQERIL